MGRIIKTTPATACGNTVKTSMGDITVPTGVTRCIGVSGYSCGGPGGVTLENYSGVITLESVDQAFLPQVVPLDPVVIVGTGMAHVQPRIWPLDSPVTPGAKITCSITEDMAIATVNLGRVTLIFE